MHGWYSTQHEFAAGFAVFEIDGKARCVTFSCSTKERGEEFIKTYFQQFTDYVYVGKVGKFLYSSHDDEDLQLDTCYPEEEE